MRVAHLRAPQSPKLVQRVEGEAGRSLKPHTADAAAAAVSQAETLCQGRVSGNGILYNYSRGHLRVVPWCGVSPNTDIRIYPIFALVPARRVSPTTPRLPPAPSP